MVSLVVDTWSDTHKQSINQVVDYSHGEIYFINSHDAFNFKKLADVLVAERATTLETMGEENVVN